MTNAEFNLAALGIVSGIVGSLSGVILGYGLSSRAQEKARQRRLSSFWAALESEIIFCGKMAHKFLGLIEDADKYYRPFNEDIQRLKTPDYRLPADAFRSSLPALLSDGELKPQDIQPLVEFYIQVDRLNRGLDNAAASRAGTVSEAEFEDQLACNVRCAINITPCSVLEVMPVTTTNTKLPPSVQGYFEKAHCNPSLHDKAMAVIKLHCPKHEK